jgi:hypothetical protein
MAPPIVLTMAAHFTRQGLHMVSTRLLNDLRVYGDLMPDTVYSLVTIHPLADEQDVLKRLDLLPEACQLCDLYWAYDKRMGCRCRPRACATT